MIVSVWPVFLPKEAGNLGESSSGEFPQPNKSIKTWLGFDWLIRCKVVICNAQQMYWKVKQSSIVQV